MEVPCAGDRRTFVATQCPRARHMGRVLLPSTHLHVIYWSGTSFVKVHAKISRVVSFMYLNFSEFLLLSSLLPHIL